MVGHDSLAKASVDNTPVFTQRKFATNRQTLNTTRELFSRAP